ncbi:hypothetical protein LL254_07025 [Marinobacter nauticus]|uniref:hypothetical protein n=1 Tax=Marinobacter nauticus TaxID=2743 RepID=UPI001D196316|nr:hypothetical protein [Marinobacter nauticus]MCC4270459.1 hypothetical protein [Marinobacter nauticus]
MTKLIIHIGMPKTGSSSIQETLFAKGGISEFIYADLGVVNHGGVITSYFSRDPYSWHGHKAVGRSRNEVDIFNKKVGKSLEAMKARCGYQILSGEDIYEHIDEHSLFRIRDYFSGSFEEIEVVGYVRSPASFMASAFIQFLKNHGQARLDMNKLWPKYRAKFEKFDRVFGRERVTLRPFSSEAMVDGDVVQDFCHFLGEPIAQADIRRVNESLSLEAAASLFVYNREGPCYETYPGQPVDNNRLMDILAEFGSQRLRFSDSLVNPIIEKHQSDLEWVEKRLGEPLRDHEAGEAGVIESEQDLLDIASKNARELEVFVRERISESTPTPLQIANLMEKLRVAITGRASNGVKPAPCEEATFFSPEQLELLSRHDTGPAVALRELALAFDRSGRRTEACNCIQAALKLRPDAKGLHSLKQRLCGN